MPSPVLTLLKEITLNLDTPNDLVYVSAKQYDVLARKVKINLVHNAAPWVIPSGLGGVIRYIKPDQTRGMYDTDDDGNPAIVITAGSSAASPGNVTITLAKQVLTTKGTIKIEVSLYSAAAEKLTTFSFPLVVEEAALSDIPFYESEDYFNFRSDMATIQQLNDAFKTATNTATSQLGLTIDNTLSIAGAIADAKAAGDMIQVSETEPAETSNILWIKDPDEEVVVPTWEDITNIVADEYDSTKAYSVGDYVIYDGLLYRCIIAIETAEAWDNSKWEQAVVCDEVSDLKSAFDNTTYLAPITLEKCQTGSYIANDSPKNVLAPVGASGTYNGKFVWDKCNSGDVYVVNLTALSGTYPWVICDKDGVVLSRGTRSQGETNKEIVIPSGGVYFGANCYNNNDSVVKKQGLPYYNKDNANITKKDVPFKFVHKYFNTTSPFDVDNVGVYRASYQGGIIWDKCKEGDVYILENVHSSIAAGYIVTICDENGNIIAHALQAGNTHDIDYVNFYVEIPENGAYIGIQCSNTTSKVSKLVPIDKELDTIKENIFKGLNGVAFGTSLTARADSSGTYGYLSTLRNELECEIDNQGVGGSYWFLVNYTNSSVRYVVQNYASYADKDFAIIEGCVNDWFTGKILGNYTDTSGQSVCADLYAMINHIYTQNPKIQIFVILDHQGRNYNDNDCSPSAVVNSKTQYEYYSELKKLCELYSIPVISEFAESNIGVFGTEYLVDNIHCNELGAEQSGQFIARKMKQIGLKVHN